MGAFGLSSSLHVVGLVGLPVLLGWSWWEVREPSGGGQEAPLRIVWAQPSQADDVEREVLEEVPPEEFRADFEEPELIWPERSELEWPPETSAPVEEAQATWSDLSSQRDANPIPWRASITKGPAAPVSEPKPQREPESPIEDFEPLTPEVSLPDPPGEPIETAWKPEPWPEHCPEPPYPSKSQRRGWQGTVQLELTVDPAGVVREVEVVRSSGHRSLDEAARRTLQTWRFLPGPEGSKTQQVQRRVEFRLP